jgi:5'-methylthioadenosine phosphorylase
MMGNMNEISVGIIGGSGLYTLLDEAQTLDLPTPYGSARVTIGEFAGREVAFLTRHGADHASAPHLIRYRAHIWALASLGVRAIVSSSAVGGLSPDLPPGSFALPDQFIDRTWGRADTFYDEGSVQHLGAADPFDEHLRSLARAALPEAAPTATAVVIQGPRFSTRAESEWFRAAGGDIVNMTMCPEVPLASELGIGTVNISFVTDSDAAVVPDGEEVSAELVFRRLREAQPRIVAAIHGIVERIPADFAPRALIDADAVAEVLARPVVP